ARRGDAEARAERQVPLAPHQPARGRQPCRAALRARRRVMAEILFSQQEIAARVDDLAREIAARRPEIAVPVLTGAFVFSADLLRALARLGLSLPMEFLWLRSYDGKSVQGAVSVIAGPSEAARGKSVLLIDGVLDSGATIAKARALLKDAGAR